MTKKNIHRASAHGGTKSEPRSQLQHQPNPCDDLDLDGILMLDFLEAPSVIQPSTSLPQPRSMTWCRQEALEYERRELEMLMKEAGLLPDEAQHGS